MKNTLVLIVLLSATALAFAAGRQQLAGPDIPQEALRHPLGVMDTAKRLHLVVELPIRNKPQLDLFLQGLYEPQSPDYHHYLTQKEFTQRFGPTQADYDAVSAFFKNKGFKVITSPGRTLLDIDGTVKRIESTFHATLRLYKHPFENRNFYAPDQNPSIDLDVPISGVAGLENFNRPHPARSHRLYLKLLPQAGN